MFAQPSLLLLIRLTVRNILYDKHPVLYFILHKTLLCIKGLHGVRAPFYWDKLMLMSLCYNITLFLLHHIIVIQHCKVMVKLSAQADYLFVFIWWITFWEHRRSQCWGEKLVRKIHPLNSFSLPRFSSRHPAMNLSLPCITHTNFIWHTKLLL